MLKGLTYSNGLPLGAKEVEMIEHARAKRELENSMPPFTDEACLALRKRMMELSELREYKIREKEIDSKRDGRLLKLNQALIERDESNEFLASQRIEALRQSRMEDREKVMQKIRKKRVKVLRRLARQRNNADPVLSNAMKRDIISQYYDHGSQVYAPLKRDGHLITNDSNMHDVASRTAPLNSLGAIQSLESTIPLKLAVGTQVRAPRSFTPTREMSSTAPAAPGGGRAAQPRLTSAAHRTLRNTKRDIEVMHTILMKKKHVRTTGMLPQDDNDFAPLGSPQTLPGSQSQGKGTGLLHTKQKNRPSTPDFSNAEEGPADSGGVSTLYSACVMLQRLLRGRAVQNSMYEGRFRRKELISELRSADTVRVDYDAQDAKLLRDRAQKIKDTTIDAVAGSVSSNLLVLLANDQVTHIS